MKSLAQQPSPDEALSAIAQSQFGLVTRQQATDAGLSPAAVRHRVETGRFEIAARNVFRLTGAPRSWEQDLLAAQLSLGPGAVVSCRSAAIQWGLLPPAKIIELSIPQTGKRVPAGWIVHRVPPIPPSQITRRGPFVITEPHRTIVDLTGVAEGDELEGAIFTGFRKGLIRLPRLKFLIRTMGTKGRRGLGGLNSLLGELEDGGRVKESLMEMKFLRLVKRAKLPQPVAQFPIRLPNGESIRIDFAYPDRRLAIECDGYEFHSDRERFEKDRERDRDLLAIGWTAMRLTWTDLTKNAQKLIAQLRRFLA